jgi:hypothetical protein
MLKLTWLPDLRAERDMKDLGIHFSVVTIKFRDIDIKESGYNGARIGGAIVTELVNDYAQGFRNGDSFPRPVVYRKAGYILTSGNQRCNALLKLIEAGEVDKNTDIEVYLMDTSEIDLLEGFARSANVSHGGRSSFDDRKAHACHMVTHFGWTVKNAAKLYMVSDTCIQTHITTERIRRELAENGIDTSQVPTETINQVSKLASDDSVFLKTASLIADNRPTAERVGQFVAKVKKAKSEPARLSEVKKFEKELKDEARSRDNHKNLKLSARKLPDRPRRDRIISSFTKIADFLDSGKAGEGFSNLAELQITTEADKKTISQLWQRIELRMSLILRDRK